MERKDPKDMTASELLRWAANGEPNEYGNVFADFKLLSALSGKPYAKINYAEDVQCIRNFADKIDAEIEAASRARPWASGWRRAVSEYIIGFTDCVEEAHMALTEQPHRSFYGQPLTCELVRCRDCVNCATAADGSGPYCAHWSRRVPWDGYCHLGERKDES